MLKRRRIGKRIEAAPNPSEIPEPDLLDLIRNWPIYLPEIAAELQKMATEADQRRFSVIVDLVREEYPDFYYFIYDLVDLTPEQARTRLLFKWPVIGLARIKFPDLWAESLPLIAILQNQIRQRREGNHEHTENRQRQITH